MYAIPVNNRILTLDPTTLGEEELKMSHCVTCRLDFLHGRLAQLRHHDPKIRCMT
jgi:hypothetical protein